MRLSQEIKPAALLQDTGRSLVKAEEESMIYPSKVIYLYTSRDQPLAHHPHTVNNSSF